MSQATTRQARPKVVEPNKKLLVVYSLDQLQQALEEQIDCTELGEAESIIEGERQKLQEITTNIKFKEKASVNQVSSKNQAAATSILVPPVEVCPLNVPKLTKFQRPDHYIKFPVHKDFVSGIRLEDNTIVHYDMTHEDEEFLESLQKSIKNITEIDFIKIIDCLEKTTNRGSEISFDEALRVIRDRNIGIRSPVVLIVYNYWRLRRQKLGKPLLRHLWPVTSPHDTSPYACFRPRIREKMTLRRPRRNSREMLDKVEKLLDDFRKVEKSFRKLRQRDEKKLLLAELAVCIFDQRRHEISDLFYRCPTWDKLKDFKIYKRSHKKEVKYPNLMLTSVSSYGWNPSQTYRQLIYDCNNLEQLLTYSWPDETTLLSFYYFGSLNLWSVLPNTVSNVNISSVSTNSLMNNNNNNKRISSALNRFALPSYILSTYKAGVDILNIEAIKNFRSPCKPHRLIKRRGRGGRIWFDRRMAYNKYEPLFTHPQYLDFGVNCGYNHQFAIHAYYRKTRILCDLIDKLCTDGLFDAYGNDAQTSGVVGSTTGSGLISGIGTMGTNSGETSYQITNFTNTPSSRSKHKGSSSHIY
ncbi:hypothetical protein ACR3K2_11820 [Cryptosporidium serpentis]